MSKKRILLVDDNAMMRREIRALFASHPYMRRSAARTRCHRASSDPTTRPNHLGPFHASHERVGSSSSTGEDIARCVADSVDAL
jgi:hypothetical protein